jgi:predicted ferric reductase
MPFLATLAIYVVRILRRPMDVRLKLRHVGPAVVSVGAVAMVLAWGRLRPAGIGTSYFVGEILGVLSVYLMTWTTILATRLKSLERWFGGLDRMYFWHRLYAIWAMLLFIPHVFVTQRGNARATAQQDATSFAQAGRALGAVALLGLIALILLSLARVSRVLRVNYRLWLFVHRFIGLLLLAALLHGWALDRVIGGSVALKTIYLVIAVAGVMAYGYDELLLRRRAPMADYLVDQVLRPSPQVTDIVLTPTGGGVPLKGGQFIYLSVGGEHRWREHPFSVAGVSPDGSVRLTIRSLGRDTRRMHENLHAGLPAAIVGPYGMFDHTVGGPRQIWVAGGIGVAPFLGWLTTDGLRELDRIDLFYSTPTETDAVFLPDLVAAAERLPNLTLHPVFTRDQGRLTTDRIITLAGPLDADTHVFLCGPAAMVGGLTRHLRRHGIPRDYIHAEHFVFR